MIFRSTTVTYAFAVEGCTQLSSISTNILSDHPMEFTLVYFLPSSQCSNAI